MYIDFPNISPIAFSVGPFDLRWYALAYLIGILSAWFLTNKNIKKYNLDINNVMLDDLVFYVTLGIILGGRLGYVLFYGNAYFFRNPLQIFAIWRGGMSFHGGIIGVILSIYIFSLKYKISFFKITDLVSLYVPIGIFLGRLANFVNGELWGRVTNVAWAVKFPAGGYLPRHPSQIYEALTEGVFMFIVLNILWRYEYVRKHQGIISAMFLIIYTASRMCMELFREPDDHIGFLFAKITMGQLLSAPLLIFGLGILYKATKKHV